MRGDIGRVLKKGKIRVDARKAMAKLREHLLVDLHLYAVEVVRAAVLAGARRIDAVYDADDVILTFDGEVVEGEALPRMFEHLTAEQEGESARRERLLALAVNAALGLDPAWVAVTSVKDGEGAKVVWSPALVKAIEQQEKGLPEVERVAAGDMPRTGTRFHFKRKVGWEMVRRAAARNLPRELQLLVDAAHCLPVPLFVNGAEAPKGSRAPALVRAAIGLPGVREAHLEITGGWSTAPHVEMCELGVVLARSAFGFGAHFPMAEHQGVAPPVRIVVDADALPTNASRSAVREDAALFGALKNAAGPALGDAIQGLVAVVFGRGSVPEGVTIDASNPTALEDALGAFLCSAEASLIARVALPEALRGLLDLPFFRDGAGNGMTHEQLPREDPLLAWDGAQAVPAEMERWARQFVWRQGRLAERVLNDRKKVDREALAGMMKEAATRHRRLMAAPKGAARVPDEAYLAREAFAFAEGPFAGLTGEVAVAADPASYVRNLGLRVFTEGRAFEAFPIPEASVPLPCVIALEWPGEIVPRFAYAGVEATKGMRAALAFAVRQAVLACERVAATRPRVGQPFDAKAALALRAALATAVLAPRRIYSAEGFEMPALAELQALVFAPVWPTTEGTFVSLQAVCEQAATTGAVCVAAEVIRGRAPDGRAVLSVSAAELEWLAACLRPGIAVVRYDAAVARAAGAGAEAPGAFVDATARLSGGPILRREGRGWSWTATVGSSETRMWHAGKEIGVLPLAESFGGVTIAIDDDSVVPAPDWRSVVYTSNPRLGDEAEETFAERLTAAMLGDAAARAELLAPSEGGARSPFRFPERPWDAAPAVKRYLIDRAARGREVDATAEERAIGERIWEMPLLPIAADGGKVAAATLAQVERLHPLPGAIPHLREAPPFVTEEWHPLVGLTRPELEALARVFGPRLRAAEDALFAQERLAAKRARVGTLRAQPVVDPRAVGARGDASRPVVHVAALPKHGVMGATVALPMPGVELASPLVEVLFEDHVVCEQLVGAVALPVVARVGVLDADDIEGLVRLSERAVGAVGARVVEAAIALALRLLEEASEAGGSPRFFGDVRALTLVMQLLRMPKRDARLEMALRGPRLLWPTVQGEARSWSELRLVDGQLWVGTVLHAQWIGAASPTDLDRPILFVPPTAEGSALVGILEGLGMKLRGVSDAIATLQAVRARGAGDKPRLARRPVDPALAQDLDKLGIQGIEGEIAIFEAGDPVAQVTALDGETRLLKLELSFPAQAVARMPVLTGSGAPIAAEQIGRAGIRLLAAQIPALDRLPGFVRDHLRGLACRAVAKGRSLAPLVAKAPLFPDIDGGLWSFEHLTKAPPGGGPDAGWSCTFDPPPYAKARQEGRTLRLTAQEHQDLLAKVNVLNVTEWMRRDLEAERRREAPPVERVRIEDAARGRLLAAAAVAEGALEGEIGLLRPEAGEARGVHVYTTRRSVCAIEDGPGWPVAAAINDDALRAGRWFDEVSPPDQKALRGKVRAVAAGLLRRLAEEGLPGEGDRLALRFVDEAVPPVTAYGSTDEMRVTGTVCLPRPWPMAPGARLFVQGLPELPRQPVLLAAAPIAPALPLAGTLFVAREGADFSRGAAHRLALALRDGLAHIVRGLLAADATDATDPEILTYAWNLRLLGATLPGLPDARGADGAAVTADDVIAALSGAGEIWLTDQRGIADGAFPERAPKFVLVDDARDPLVRVLRARVPAAKLKVLGEVAARAPARREAPSDLPPASVRALAPRSSPPPAGAEAAPFDAGAVRPRAGTSWLGSIVDRALGVFSAGPPLDPTPLGDAVERSLRALRLRDEPVIAVHEVTRGRLVRYEKDRRVVLINVAHPAVARHVASTSAAVLRRATTALVAAALSEINIALEHVTDHDEAQALAELLRQEAAASQA